MPPSVKRTVVHSFDIFRSNAVLPTARWAAVAMLLILPVCSAMLSSQPRPTALVLEGGTLIDGTGGPVLEDSAVVIQGGKFAAIGKRGAIPYPPEAQRIDVKGQYIVPGLIDGHVHSAGWDGELFLAHGVTTIVDVGNVTEWILTQRDGVAKGKIRGPRIFASGSGIRGPLPDRAFDRYHHIVVISSENAHKEVRARLAAGVDVVKVFDGLTRDMLSAIITEAHTANTPVVGHTANAREAVELGYQMIVHTPGIPAACPGKDSKAREIDPHASVDFDCADRLFTEMASKGVYLNPTLRAAWNWAYRDRFQYEDFNLLFNNENLRYVPLGYRLGILREYNRIDGYPLDETPPSILDAKRQAHANVVTLLKHFAAKGGKLVVGSDTMSTPGLSLHQEMELMVDLVGLSPMETLLTVTKYPAEAFQVSDKVGTIKPGKLADLVILRADPLSNIKNTRTIARVFKDGKEIDTKYHGDYQNPVPLTVPEDTAHLVPSPVIEDVSPKVFAQSKTPGQLTIKGAGFIRSSVVNIAGHTVVPTFKSSFELVVEVPVSLLQTGAALPVTVVNLPGPTGTIYGEGLTYLRHLGTRDEKSNTFNIIVL